MEIQATTDVAQCSPHRSQTNPPDPVVHPLALDEEPSPQAVIAQWHASGNADDFPFDAVVAEFHRVGKHLVASELLDALAGVRAALPNLRGSGPPIRLLERFLDTALDKRDGRYANPTYLGLSSLPLADVDDPGYDNTADARKYDRLLVQLIADAMRFELAAADGATDLLPHLRPDARTTAKRCRLGLQIVGPAAHRLGLRDGIDVSDSTAGARRLWANLAADLQPVELRTLQLTMLPVSTVHDEYQFIRILQSFEATFALMAVQVTAAIRALTDGSPDHATRHIAAGEQALHEAAPLFSLVATMRVEAFQAFRVYTDGASAIQSRNYKLVESICLQPDPTRLDSAAYLAVPEVRQRVLAGQLTLDEAYAAARAAGRLSSDDIADLEQAMRRFAATLLRWRRTHHQLAVRMLGERTGTGYTEGASYLKAVQPIPVFRSFGEDEINDAEARDSDSGEAIAPTPTHGGLAPRGRCPFSSGRAFP